METRYLKEFLVLRDTLSFSEAANRLFITQSSLSKHIRSLEEDLGAPLFYRDRRHVQLTKYGERILPAAHAIIDAEESIARALSFSQNNRLLAIGLSPSMEHDDLYRDLLESDFSLSNGRVTLRLIMDDTNNLMTSLRAGTCDYAFLRAHDNTDWMRQQFNTVSYKTERMYVILRADHPLAGRPSLQLKELRNENFLMLQPGTFPTLLCESECGKAGFVPRGVYYSHSGGFVRRLVTQGKGVFFTFTDKIIDIDNPDLVYIPIVPAVEVHVMLCWNKDREMQEKDQIFMRFLSRYFSSFPD